MPGWRQTAIPVLVAALLFVACTAADSEPRADAVDGGEGEPPAAAAAAPEATRLASHLFVLAGQRGAPRWRRAFVPADAALVLAERGAERPW